MSTPLNHHDTDRLNLNEIGLCEVALNAPVAFDPYQKCKGTGSFIIIDRITNVTVGAGMIDGPISDENSIQSVSAAERASRYAQQPVIILLNGKHCQATAEQLERKLFDAGHASAVLDSSDNHDALELTLSTLLNSGLVCILKNPESTPVQTTHIAFDCTDELNIYTILETLNKNGVLF